MLMLAGKMLWSFKVADRNRYTISRTDGWALIERRSVNSDPGLGNTTSIHVLETLTPEWQTRGSALTACELKERTNRVSADNECLDALNATGSVNERVLDKLELGQT